MEKEIKTIGVEERSLKPKTALASEKRVESNGWKWREWRVVVEGLMAMETLGILIFEISDTHLFLGDERIAWQLCMSTPPRP